MNSNQTKYQTLGMPYATARKKLDRMIIAEIISGRAIARMNFTQRCGYCGVRIGSSGDMAIGHRQPWEGQPNGKDLFFDLDNVVFHHKDRKQCDSSSRTPT